MTRKAALRAGLEYLIDGRVLTGQSGVRGIGVYLRGLLSSFDELGVADRKSGRGCRTTPTPPGAAILSAAGRSAARVAAGIVVVLALSGLSPIAGSPPGGCPWWRCRPSSQPLNSSPRAAWCAPRRRVRRRGLSGFTTPGGSPPPRGRGRGGRHPAGGEIGVGQDQGEADGDAGGEGLPQGDAGLT